MAFPAVPTVSKSRIRAAGDLLVSEGGSIGDSHQARKLLAEWRACHLYPLDAFATDLQMRLTRLGIDATVGLRLKRLFRIVEKLRQSPQMNATTMQDIAGLRAITSSFQEADRIVKDYQSHPPVFAEAIEVRDYMVAPKDGGYRSVHLTFRSKGLTASTYDGLKIELQVRTSAQHLWASAVEITGMWTGQRVKYDEGDPDWTEFFDLVAELIARRECTPASAGFANISDEDVRSQLIACEKKIDAVNVMLTRMRTMPKVEFADKLAEHPLASFLLLKLDPNRRKLTIESFNSDSHEDALLAYAEAELLVTFSDGDVAPVLVSVSSGARLHDAYRSFFQDIMPFADLLAEILGPNAVE